MKRFTLTALGALIVVKIVLGTIFIMRIDFGSWFPDGVAIAAETTTSVDGQSDTGAAPASLQNRAAMRAETEVLEKKRAELLAIQADINAKIETLRKLRSEIKSQVAQSDAREEGKLKHLIKVYSTMKPQKAATLIEKLDLSFTTVLLSRMKGDAVGNILSFVDTDKAALISQALIKPSN